MLTLALILAAVFVLAGLAGLVLCRAAAPADVMQRFEDDEAQVAWLRRWAA